MPRVFHGNFEFEHELAEGSRFQLSRKLQRINALWAGRLTSLMSSGDALFVPGWNLLNEIEQTTLLEWCGELQLLSQPRMLADEFEDFIPWGWTEGMVLRAESLGLSCSPPSLDAVRWLNARGTSFELEQTFEVAPPGCRRIGSIAELEEHLTSFDAEAAWVIKAEFGMSGRERILGRGTNLQLIDQGWLQRRLTGSGRVYFEPWFDRLEEMSFHYEIAPDGVVRFLGATRLQCDDCGRYQSNQHVDFEGSPDLKSEWAVSRTTTEACAKRAAERSYFGPLSIDSMRYRTSDRTIRERPLQDINGRWTMGRCELERALRER
ncbi:hypothetical protein [Rubinisphaera margarita]|uniref:hypothetical protein n=1 Tax=Rubinisphaera margarita TaxID=2909586 RepID=UPI001EE86361|nr:hypothetical protein [Rubinisphaera margarita]MCG6154443.1 hypothetical protein [Rubinisphaera margarita]